MIKFWRRVLAFFGVPIGHRHAQPVYYCPHSDSGDPRQVWFPIGCTICGYRACPEHSTRHYQVTGCPVCARGA